MKILTQSEIKARLQILKTLRMQATQIEEELAVTLAASRPEALAKAVGTLKHIAEKTKHRSLRRLCLQAINDVNGPDLEAAAKSYYRQGVADAIALLQSKVDQANEVDSRLNAVIGEVYISELKKLIA